MAIIYFLLFHTFLSRILTNFIGFNLLNLLNLFLVPIIFIFIKKSEGKGIFYLFIFLILTSTIVNKISYSNVIIYICIVLYPLFIHEILGCIIVNRKIVNSFDRLLFLGFSLNIIMSYLQFFTYGIGDEVKGVFLNMGAGHHINGAISLIYSLSLFIKDYSKNKIMIFLTSIIVILSDSKQVVLAIIVGLILHSSMSLIKFLISPNKIQHFKVFIYGVFSISLLYIFFLIIFNYNFIYFNISIINPEYLFGGIVKKFQFLNYLNLSNIINLLFGNGPGMTVSKLAYMANYENKYWQILNLINYQYSELALTIRDLQFSDWQTDFRSTGSSLFQMTFSIGGIFGDTGLLSTIIYIVLLRKIFIYDKKSFLNAVVFYTILALGLIFSWLEEPNFILIVILICFIRFKKFNSYN